MTAGAASKDDRFAVAGCKVRPLDAAGPVDKYQIGPPLPIPSVTKNAPKSGPCAIQDRACVAAVSRQLPTPPAPDREVGSGATEETALVERTEHAKITAALMCDH